MHGSTKVAPQKISVLRQRNNIRSRRTVFFIDELREKNSQDKKGQMRMLRENVGFAEEKRSELGLEQIMAVALLLAAGAVLKFFIGSLFAVGMKPNFIIAMYCLAILLVKPTLKEALIIGLLAGAVCQFFPGTPYINFISEAAGALFIALAERITPRKMIFRPAFLTFLATAVSGLVFLLFLKTLFLANSSGASLSVFGAIIAGTSAINAVIVQMLFVPLSKAMKRLR